MNKSDNHATATSGINKESIKVNVLPHAGELKKVMLYYLIKGMIATKLPWKKTAWTCAGFPVEFLWAYGMFPLHPENMSTVAAARKQSQRLIEHPKPGLLALSVVLLQNQHGRLRHGH
jgi:hypothetical protein